MERFEPTRADLLRLAQTRLNLVHAGSRILLRQCPTEMDQTKCMPEGERHLFGKAHALARSGFDPLRSAQPDIRNRNSVAQCEADRVGVNDLPSPSPAQIFLAHPSSLIGKTQVPKTP